MIIDNIKDARDGDRITYDWRSYSNDGDDDAWESGHNGPVRIDSRGDYLVADTWVAKAGGEPAPGVRVTHIERPTPPLPTEPGSVILDVVLDSGESFPWAVLLNNDARDSAPWATPTDSGFEWISVGLIASFTLAKVVPA